MNNQEILFEWDSEKEKQNIAKHKIDFRTAAHVFEDNNRMEFYDSAHSTYEDRFAVIGEAAGTLVILFVTYTAREPYIRIISARRATKREKEVYYACKNNA